MAKNIKHVLCLFVLVVCGNIFSPQTLVYAFNNETLTLECRGEVATRRTSTGLVLQEIAPLKSSISSFSLSVSAIKIEIPQSLLTLDLESKLRAAFAEIELYPFFLFNLDKALESLLGCNVVLIDQSQLVVDQSQRSNDFEAAALRIYLKKRLDFSRRSRFC